MRHWTYRDEKRIAPYADALRGAGIEPVMVTPDAPIDSLDGMGLVLAGGTDVGPGAYGAEAEPLTERPTKNAMRWSRGCCAEALEKDLARAGDLPGNAVVQCDASAAER